MHTFFDWVQHTYIIIGHSLYQFSVYSDFLCSSPIFYRRDILFFLHDVNINTRTALNISIYGTHISDTSVSKKLTRYSKLIEEIQNGDGENKWSSLYKLLEVQHIRIYRPIYGVRAVYCITNLKIFSLAENLGNESRWISTTGIHVIYVFIIIG
jgi:hypothetical protein